MGMRLRMNILYNLQSSPFSEDFVNHVHKLAELIFGNVSRDDFVWRLEHLPDVSVQVAQCGGTLIGFKFGHGISSRRYLSWLGGVSPDYRGKGVARELMQRQHDWLSQKQYAGVETSAANNNLAMIQLNLQFGFEIIGSYYRHGTPRVILYKRLID